MPDSVGDAAQIRLIADQVAEATIIKMGGVLPAEEREATIPPPLKWAAGIIAALFTLGVGAMVVWLVTTVNTMQVTLARMDERMENQGPAQDRRFAEIDRRIVVLETKTSAEGPASRAGH